MKVYLILSAILACASHVSCGILRGVHSYLPPPLPSSEYAVGYGSGNTGGVSSASSNGYTSSGQSISSLSVSNPGWSGSNSANPGWLELSSDQSSSQSQPSDGLGPTGLNHGGASLEETSSGSNGISAFYGGPSSLGVHSNRGINSGIRLVYGLRPGNTVNEGTSQRTETVRIPVAEPVEEEPQSVEVPQPIRVEAARPYPVPVPRPYPVNFRVNEYVEEPTQVRENVPRPHPVVAEKPYQVRVPTRLEVNTPAPVNVDQSQSIFGNSGFSSGIIAGLGIRNSYRFNSGLNSGLSGGFGPIGLDSGLAGGQESGLSGGWTGNDPNIKSSSVCACGQGHSTLRESESSQSSNGNQNSLYDNNGGYSY